MSTKTNAIANMLTADQEASGELTSGAGLISLHLLRLVSPGLPVGAFSYSRGLEAAVEHGWVNDEESARGWITGTLEHVFAVLDGALFCRMLASLEVGDRDSFLDYDAWLRASRESRELELEDLRMGAALRRLLCDLGVPSAHDFSGRNLSYPGAFAVAACHWRIPRGQALRGLIWSVFESQVSAAIRLVPLGQTAGQRIMIGATEVIERSAVLAERRDLNEIGNTATCLAIASARHETQYSRLFRS